MIDFESALTGLDAEIRDILRQEVEAIEPQYEGDDGVRWGSAIDRIVELIKREHARSSERTEGDRKLLQWLGKGRGVGLSSKAIALTALGEMPDRPDYPHDPDDFYRCRALLENIPFAKRGLEKLGTDGGPIWAALVERWDEIDAQFEASECAGWKDDGKCYRLMQSIIYPVLGWRVPVSGSTEGGNG